MVAIGRHPNWDTRNGPHSARLGHPGKLVRWRDPFRLSYRQLRVCIRDGHVGEEQSRVAPGPDETVQPFAMVSVRLVGRYQDLPKENQTRGHATRIIRQVEAHSSTL